MNKRREIIKAMGIGSIWSAPVVQSVFLPAHAATTDPTDEAAPPSCSEIGGATIRVYDDGNFKDDVFEVYLDGTFLFATPAGGAAGSETCNLDIASGEHTLRIIFVNDIDSDNTTADGTYIIELTGATFVSGPGITSPTSVDQAIKDGTGQFNDYIISIG